MPLYYDKEGMSVKLYPQPAASAVTLTQGLKAFFQRTSSPFVTADLSDTTKSPGFRSTYHHILPYMIALPYVTTYKKDRVVSFTNKINEFKQDIKDHYGRRTKDEPRRVLPAFASNK
jgi:hypothetical protein